MLKFSNMDKEEIFIDYRDIESKIRLEDNSKNYRIGQECNECAEKINKGTLIIKVDLEMIKESAFSLNLKYHPECYKRRLYQKLELSKEALKVLKQKTEWLKRELSRNKTRLVVDKI